jgi:hypothetical protein
MAPLRAFLHVVRQRVRRHDVSLVGHLPIVALARGVCPLIQTRVVAPGNTQLYLDQAACPTGERAQTLERPTMAVDIEYCGA